MRSSSSFRLVQLIVLSENLVAINRLHSLRYMNNRAPKKQCQLSQIRCVQGLTRSRLFFSCATTLSLLESARTCTYTLQYYKALRYYRSGPSEPQASAISSLIAYQECLWQWWKATFLLLDQGFFQGFNGWRCSHSFFLFIWHGWPWSEAKHGHHTRHTEEGHKVQTSTTTHPHSTCEPHPTCRCQAFDLTRVFEDQSSTQESHPWWQGCSNSGGIPGLSSCFKGINGTNGKDAGT